MLLLRLLLVRQYGTFKAVIHYLIVVLTGLENYRRQYINLLIIGLQLGEEYS